MNKEKKDQLADIRDQIALTDFAPKAFEQFPAKVAILTPDFRIAWMNEELREAIGSERMGEKCFKVYQNNPEKCKDCPLSQPPQKGATQKVICEGALENRIIEFAHKSISIGKNQFILEVWNDITERREAEHELSWLATFPEKNPTPILEWDSELNLTYTNPAAKDYVSLGTGKHPLTPDNFASIVESMKNNNERRRIQELRRQDKVFSEYIYLLPEESVVRLYAHDITSRKKFESRYHQSKRDLVLLTRCNELLIRAKDEKALLNDVCEAIVQIGGYCLAWVGFANHDEQKSVNPVAQSGFDRGYLDKIHISWSEKQTGQGPTGKAIRTNKPQTAHIMSDSDYGPWKEEAIDRGYASSIALPLSQEEGIYGALNIYSTDPDAFDKKEIDILSELADDLAFGIKSIRESEKRRSLENELQHLSKHLLNAREEERNRISRELHDELGQLITAIIISLSDYRSKEESAVDPAAKNKLGEIEDMIETLDNKVRDLAVDIRPPSMEELGLIPTLESDLEEIEKTHDVQTTLTSDKIESVFDPDEEIHVYRLIQEAVTNSLKHGEPDNISIKVDKANDSIKLTIHDDGKGFDVAEVAGTRESRERLGIIGMRERVNSLSGSIDIDSTPGEGTTVRAQIPYDTQNELN